LAWWARRMKSNPRHARRRHNLPYFRCRDGGRHGGDAEMHRQAVESRNWMNRSTSSRSVAIAQPPPTPEIMNVTLSVIRRPGGINGLRALSATAAMCGECVITYIVSRTVDRFSRCDSGASWCRRDGSDFRSGCSRAAFLSSWRVTTTPASWRSRFTLRPPRLPMDALQSMRLFAGAPARLHSLV